MKAPHIRIQGIHENDGLDLKFFVKIKNYWKPIKPTGGLLLGDFNIEIYLPDIEDKDGNTKRSIG